MKTASSDYPELSARERQIMDQVYLRGEVTVALLKSALPNPPSGSAIRTMLTRLERKGHLDHIWRGGRNVYLSTGPKELARDSVLKRLIRIFFEGSPADMVARILDQSAAEMSDEELDSLAELVEDSRQARQRSSRGDGARSR